MTVYDEYFYSEDEVDEICDRAGALGLEDDPQLSFITVRDMERMVTYLI